jgi:tetratricopeptide (TPR) repeat protein
MASIPVDMDEDPPAPPAPPPPPSPPPARPEPEARVIIAAPPSKPVSVAPPPAPSRPASVAPPAAPSSAVEHMAAGDALRLAGDQEGALTAYKRALGMLGSGATQERAEIYVRQGQAKQALGLRREAIAAFEKALSLAPQKEVPAHLLALEALLALNVAEADWRAVAATEERVLGTLASPDDRFTHLKLFGARWQDDAGDPERARAALERARELRPDDLAVLGRLRALYEQAGMGAEALATRRRVAELTRDPRERARLFFELGQHCLFDLRREDLGLTLLDKALESDPTMLEPLAVVARVLADRQEWSELEQAYRRMLDRVDHTAQGPVRSEVTWELCRRLGFMFRDHLDDPGLALDAFEDAVHAKPLDLQTRLTAAELGRALGKNDRAAVHLEAAAGIDPTRAATYHDLFESFQKLRRPDQAYQAAAVTMHLRQADARERFIFEEHKPHGVPTPAYALRAEAWEWLRPHDRDTRAEAVLRAVTPAAIAARLSQLGSDGRLPSLDPAGKQDPEKSTVSIVRSFAWASHYLAVPAPAVYLSDEPGLALASVVAEEATVFAGQKVLRGRSLTELAFLVGRHLAYHVGGHRLVLYYPSIEELTAVFLAAVRLVLPEVPAPAALRAAVAETERGISLRLTESARVDLAAAVAAFESGGSRAHLAEWVASVERCATRAGFLLAGDLEIAAGILRTEGRGILDPEAKLADLLSFAVSDEHRALREALGIAIQP